jgi:iron complex transport system substrate-binding protein
MRICSFLPSATEILFALDLGDAVAGVTFECDYPAEAIGKQIVVDTILKHGLSQAEIDREVAEHASRGESLYRVDVERLEAIKPDLMVTQELCDVCAVSSSHLVKALFTLSSRPEVLTLTPHTLEDVFTDIERVGAATDRVAQAAELVRSLRRRVAAVQASGKPHHPRVACLEWLDPPFSAGHWMPEMVALAGGVDPLGKSGEYSERISWQQVLDADPEVVLVMPCGYDLAQSAAEFRKLELPSGWADVSAVRNGRVFAVNATACFSRPGPRLVDGLETMRALFQENFNSSLPEKSWARL